jgi:hypothetical protein
MIVCIRDAAAVCLDTLSVKEDAALAAPGVTDDGVNGKVAPGGRPVAVNTTGL